MDDKKSNAGRPAIYKDPVKFAAKIDEYFEYCDYSEDTYRVTALALWLGMNSKDTLYQYGKKPQFSDSVKMARTKIEDQYVKRALERDKVTGEIFILKASYGYKEGVEVEHGLKDKSKDGKITIEWVASEDKNPGEV